MSEICWDQVGKEIFFNISYSWGRLAWGLGRGETSNEPTHYPLDNRKKNKYRKKSNTISTIRYRWLSREIYIGNIFSEYDLKEWPLNDINTGANFWNIFLLLNRNEPKYRKPTCSLSYNHEWNRDRSKNVSVRNREL